MSIRDKGESADVVSREEVEMPNAAPLNIVFAMHNEEGHCNGSFGLAKRLRDRGYRVIYLGLMDARRFVSQQGFEFVPFAEDILPEGATRGPAEPETGSGPALMRWWRQRRANEKLFQAFLRSLTNGHLDERLLSTKPDVVICDTCLWYVGLRAIALGIPTVNISISVTGYPNGYTPPYVGARIPRDSWWGRMQVRGDWWRLRCQFIFTKRLASMVLGRFRAPTRMHHLTDEFVKLARRSGIACRENRTYRFSEIGPRLILPEVVLPARSFDFANAPEIDQRHIGDFVDLSRKEDEALLGGLDAEKPLVYCSLGSASRFYPHSGHFFRTVAAASSKRKDWQWVLSVGTRQEMEGLGKAGSNLLVVNWAPQLAILKRAAVMVTHGGINSIAECIHFTVPMVIVPGLRDQPGNKARAMYHGLAVAGEMKDITAEELVNLIDTAIHSADMRDALLRMKKNIAAEPGMEAAVELVEAQPARSRNEAESRSAALIYICVRETANWANEAEFQLQLRKEFKPTIEVWNRTFNIPYHLFRHRLREIARTNLGAVQNAECRDWKDVPDGGLVLPVDDDDWFAEDVGTVIEQARDERRRMYRWDSLFLEVPINLGHQLYLWKRHLLHTAPKWICTTNNYALVKSQDNEPQFRSHIRASDWFHSHPEAVRQIGTGAELSIMNRTLASRTSLGLMRPETCKAIPQRTLLRKYEQYRDLYARPDEMRPAWCRPYVRMMAELMSDLLRA